MKKRFNQALEQATIFHTLYVLLVVIYLRARHALPNLRLRHLLFPAVFAQIIVFFFAIQFPAFLFFSAIGNLIIAGIAFYPSTIQRPLPIRAHWVK